MTIREAQNKFCELVALLIQFAYANGYTLSFGDAWAKDGHKKESLHYARLAIDLNLFRDGKYLSNTEDHVPLGEYWKSLHPNCRWGGDFSDVKDGNHYEFLTVPTFS
jgi:hypothetical protein